MLFYALSIISIFVTAPEDYDPLNTTFTIPAGSAQYLTRIQIRTDDISENPETFRVVLRNPSVGALIAQPVTTVSIISLVGKSRYIY
jgi:hypothetical protein